MVRTLIALVILAASAHAQTAPVGSWTTRATSPGPIGGCATASDGTYIYCFGGDSYGTNGAQGEGMIRFNPATNSYTVLLSLPQQTLSNCGGYHNGTVYSFGATFLPYPPGAGGAFVADAIQKYSIAANTWTTLAIRSNANGDYASTAKIGTKIYILGGAQNTAGWVSGATTEFDPVAETLTARAPMPVPSSWHASAAVNGKAYVVGAWNPTTNLNNETYEFDPVQNLWTKKANVTAGGVEVQRGLPGAFGLNNKIYVTGGYDTTIENSTLEFDPANNTWRDVAPMALGRLWHSAEVVGTKGYVLGGYGNQGAPDPNLTCEEFIAPDWGSNPVATNVLQIAEGNVAPQGGTVYGMVTFSVDVTDADLGQLVRFDVKVKKSGDPDWSTSTDLTTDFTAQGTLTLTMPIVELGKYDWKWRVMDAYGNQSAAGWTEFEGNAVSPDFTSVTRPVPPSGDSGGGGGGGGCSVSGSAGGWGLLGIAILLAAGLARR